ncbi:MAG: hypothetical protein ACTHMA_22555 [Thermomicrobiales bacterium]
MQQRVTLRVASLFLALGLLSAAAPAAAATTPGVSVAPMAGAPGTRFVVTGAGFAPNLALKVLVERGQVFGHTFDATADSAGWFQLTVDSTGFAASPNYDIAVTPQGGGALASAPFAVSSTINERCFDETGKCIRGRFLDYWNAHGGLAINGFPLSDEFSQVLDDGHPYAVQYFERVRMEYHPENADPQYQVLLGQFGRVIHPADPPANPDQNMVWFPQTGHNVYGPFYQYWTMNGGLAQFGLPLSEPFNQTLENGQQYLVQYFERARFEYHAENQPPYDVLLGQFGRRVYAGLER